MAQVRIKTVKPFAEQKVQAKGLKENIIAGTRVYNTVETEVIRKDYLKNFSTVLLARWENELEELKRNTSITEEAFIEKVTELEDKISAKNQEYLTYQDSFCREHIAYFKNVSIVLEVEDEETSEIKEVKLLVQDTREAKPSESLWDTEDECLVVLLDFYLSHPAYRDSLHTAVSTALFSTNFKGLEAKN